MSEHIVKLIPCMHTYRTNPNAAQSAVQALKRLVEADEITFEQPDRPVFVETCRDGMIFCPRCGAAVDHKWWRDKIAEMEQAEDGFFILEQDLPCCGKNVSFNNLKYEQPSGFATMIFTIRNPKTPVGKEVTDALSERFGLLFRVVETEI